LCNYEKRWYMVMKIIEVLGGLLGQPIVEKLMTAVGDKNKFEADINNFLQHQHYFIIKL
jgi:hypothetical protein